MRILFIWSAAEFSTFDVARGYANALKAAGHNVHDYRLYNRLKYHALGLSHNDPPRHKDPELVTRLAAETLVVEALRHEADLVVGVCGMGLHPVGLQLLSRAGFPIAMIFTEAPYDDEHHAKFARFVGHAFTNEQVSAAEHGWGYLGAAYDPAIHFPHQADPAERCDVLILGTGWEERQQLLEGVDWKGIDLRIRGFWMGIKKRTPLRRFYQEGSVENTRTPVMYASARVCVNQHRSHPTARSLNPRALELGAVGAYQISDRRAELTDVYGETVPTYSTPAELEALIREALALPEPELRRRAYEQRAKLLAGRHTFADRAAAMMASITGGAGS